MRISNGPNASNIIPIDDQKAPLPFQHPLRDSSALPPLPMGPSIGKSQNNTRK